MIGKFVLPALAVVGVIFAVYTVVTGNRPMEPAKPVALPPQAAFAYSVAGSGIIEASTENIAVGTNVPGVVSEVFVKVGDRVKAGAPLFRVDDRDLRAEAEVRRALLKSAEAKNGTERASVADVKHQLELWQAVTDPRAVVKEDLDRRRFAVQIAEAKLVQSEADIASAKAQLAATEIEISRRLVTSPVAGEVLQVNVRVGEYATAGHLPTPLMMVGDTDTLHVRVDVDENDAWRVRPEAKAVAFVRGNRDLNTPVKFVRLEPYVVPKKSLTGDSTERVDTRVLQVLYSFNRTALPVYVGQQVDVSIESPAVK